MNKKTVLLSFDVEEFDIPLEYGQKIRLEEQLAVGRLGFEKILRLLAEEKVAATLYCTAFFAKENTDLMEQAACVHEIASHGLRHSDFALPHLRASRELLTELVQREVAGYRSARFAPVARSAVAAAGYRYNSSENPIWLPGRYNGWKRPRRVYLEAGIPQLPLSASPLIRFPLFWLAFKNVPWPLFQFFSAWTLAQDGVLHLLFHPWEFCDLRAYALPRVVRRVEGEALLHRLRIFLRWLAGRASFAHTVDYLSQRNIWKIAAPTTPAESSRKRPPSSA